MTHSQRALAAFFTLAGAMHFIRPRQYEAIVPPYVPRHREVVIVSGLAELAGAALVVPETTRRAARWWLIALLAAVFPANVHMAVHPDRIGGLDTDRLPRWLLWARLPLQPLMALWVWWATRPD
jgi:uncharacterized membrane protein